ncbi:MAG: hypothetical protein INR71_11130 [Terriglobus roseus]|nr:hypothetical protein [Terriglobus roseus]
MAPDRGAIKASAAGWGSEEKERADGKEAASFGGVGRGRARQRRGLFFSLLVDALF